MTKRRQESAGGRRKERHKGRKAEIRLWQQPQGSRGCLKQRGARISV